MKRASEVDPITRLRAFADGYPTQRAAAKALGISAPYLTQLLNGDRELSDEILKRLGLRRVIVEAA